MTPTRDVPWFLIYVEPCGDPRLWSKVIGLIFLCDGFLGVCRLLPFRGAGFLVAVFISSYFSSVIPYDSASLSFVYDFSSISISVSFCRPRFRNGLANFPFPCAILCEHSAEIRLRNIVSVRHVGLVYVVKDLWVMIYCNGFVLNLVFSFLSFSRFS